MFESDANMMACPFQQRADENNWTCQGADCMAWQSQPPAYYSEGLLSYTGYCKLIDVKTG